MGALVLLAACSFLPASRECEHVRGQLGLVEGIRSLKIECEAGVFAADGAKAAFEYPDGGTLKFAQLGFNAFGSAAVNVVLVEAGSLVPRVASCGGISAPNFHRESPLGHHFQPTLIDAKEAASRHRELLEEVEFWPECPQYWEVQDRRGQNYRYCARKKGAAGEPPKPDHCR